MGELGKKSIVVKLQGGLGNQMFQYACGLATAKKFNRHLYLDLSDYDRGQNRIDFTLRKFELNVFQIKANIYPKKNFARYAYPLNVKDQTKYHAKRMLNQPAFVSINEQNFTNIDKIKPYYRIYLDGYWQHERYFKAYKDVLRNHFQLRQSLDKKNQKLFNAIKTASEPVSIHVRRGDYISNKRYHQKYGFCGLEYYYRAVEYMKSQISEPSFFIFSDDPEWVKSNLKIDNSICIDNGNEAWQDFTLMRQCRHNIIANSTFSWWPAWLNENPDKIVIAPKNWFNDPELNESRKDIVPASWNRM